MRTLFVNPKCSQYYQYLLNMLVIVLLFFSFPAYAFPAREDTGKITNKIPFTAASSKTYSFTDMKVTGQDSTINISGRVRATGKQLRGHIDIAVFDSSGILKKVISVKPYFNNRPGIGTRYTTGFPFRAKIHFDQNIAADKYTIRLVLHCDSQRSDSVYDCGENKAVRE